MHIASAGTLAKRRFLLITAALVVLAAVAAAIALSRGTETNPRNVAATNSGREFDAPRGRQSVAGPAVVDPLAGESDPERFSHSVALALFEWDTSAGTPLSEYTGRLLAVADPTGEESPGLVADIASYLPTPEVWEMLRPYATRQWLTVSSIEVPPQWNEAIAATTPRALLPGTTAYTVTGVRHRSGVWEGERVGSKHKVGFTVFIVCGPAYPDCHLLRLSRLDEPLH